MPGDNLLNDYAKPDVPVKVAAQVTHAVAGLIPGVAAVSDAIERGMQIRGEVVANTLQRRLVEVVQVLALRNGIAVEEIVGDGQFYAGMVTAARAYQQSGDVRKIDALMAALGHVGSWAPDDSAIQRSILTLVEQLEPEHIVCLKTMMDPQGVARAEGLPEITNDVSLGQLIGKRLDLGEAELDREVIEGYLTELYNFGVVAEQYTTSWQALMDPAEQPIRFILRAKGVKLLDYLTPVTPV